MDEYNAEKFHRFMEMFTNHNNKNNRRRFVEYFLLDTEKKYCILDLVMMAMIKFVQCTSTILTSTHTKIYLSNHLKKRFFYY